MIGTAIAVAVLATLIWVALRREQRPTPPLIVTITVDTTQFVEGMRRVAAAGVTAAEAMQRLMPCCGRTAFGRKR